MKESIGYTITLNIAIVFIVIIFALIAMALSYYRAYKVGNVITSSIEKYEGYNQLAEVEIESKLSSLGYNKAPNTNCPSQKSNCALIPKGTNNTNYSTGERGYCAYLCMYDEDPNDDSDNYFHYKVETNMMWNIPIINNILNIPVENNTKKMFEFGAWNDWQEFVSDCQSRNGTIQNNSCTCSGEGRTWNAQNKCSCTGGKEWNGSSCQCPDDKPNWDGGSCVAACINVNEWWDGRRCVSHAQQTCESSSGSWNGNSCTCSSGLKFNIQFGCIGEVEYNCYDSGGYWIGSSCQCPDDKPNLIGGKCVSFEQYYCEGSNGTWNGSSCQCNNGQSWSWEYLTCQCPNGTYLKNGKCVSKCELYGGYAQPGKPYLCCNQTSCWNI